MKTPVIKLLIALAFTATLHGCGDSGPPDGPSAQTTSSDAKGKEASQVVVFTWEEYFAPEVIERFEQDTGIEVVFEYYENLGDMNGKLLSSPDAFDIIVVDDMSLAQLIELQMVRPLDHARIPNLTNIDPRYMDKSFDPGNQYSVPYTWGTTLIAYRADQIEDPNQSWKVLWDPAYKGKVAMLDEKDDIYSATLLSLGYPLNSEDPEHLAAATAELMRQVEAVDVRYYDLETAKDLIMNGKIWLFMTYSGDAAILAAEDENISFFIPEEGAPMWEDSFAIAREAQHVEEAHTFINYLADAKAAADNANYLWYATPNKAAKAYLNEELLEDETVFPDEEILAKCELIDKGGVVRDRMTKLGLKDIFDKVREKGLVSE